MTIKEIKKIIKERSNIKNISVSKDRSVFLEFSATGEDLKDQMRAISNLFEIEKRIYFNTFFRFDCERYEILKIK